jgi:maleate cis-trans isomerase
MYGVKMRIGGINPSRINETMLYQFYSIFPPGSGVTWATISLGSEVLSLNELDRVRGRIIEAAMALADTEVDIIVQSGVPVVASRGQTYGAELVHAITQATGLTAVTDIGSTINALRFIGAKRVAVATPFDSGLNKFVHDYLESSGFTVEVIRGISGLPSERPLSLATAQLPLTVTYQFARETALLAPKSDALYVAGAPMPFVENIKPLEDELRKPIVGSLPAMLWNCFTTLDRRIRIEGFGRLLASLG